MTRQIRHCIPATLFILLLVMLFVLPVQGGVSARYISNCYLLSDSLAVDSLLQLPADTLSSDTTEKKSNAIDAPVIYESNDSMVWVRGGNAYLYGEAKVNYQNI